MSIQSTVSPFHNVTADWLIVPVSVSAGDSWLTDMDQALGGLISRLRADGDVTGKLSSLVPLRGVTGVAPKRILLMGVGNTSELTIGMLDKAWTAACRSLTDQTGRSVALAIPSSGLGSTVASQVARSAATSSLVAGVGQDLFRTERARFPFAAVQIVTASPIAELSTAVSEGEVLGDAVNLARDLVNRPPQEITPAGFAVRAEAVARTTGLKIDVLLPDRLIQERMNALLAVSRGSAQPPRLVVMEYQGAGADAPKLALVGKGVTFDSGGLSLKPNDGMLTMKCDMAGAATVLATMQAIATLKLPINVMGLMGLVENMPGGNAFKLGDILTARNGVTIEVLNTDAEGRLVLADVLSYAVDLGASKIVDLATLTGACVVALGEDVVGAFTNHQEWCNAVLAAADRVGEEMWQLPMYGLYDDLIKGDVGDLKNTGGRWGGAITAAKFLQRFVAQKPWVHLDIAGPAFASSNKPHREAGATGSCVRTLVDLAKNYR